MAESAVRPWDGWAWWSGSLRELVAADPEHIVNRLAGEAVGLLVTSELRRSWRWTVDVCAMAAAQVENPDVVHVALEFVIPRRGGRPDLLLITRDEVVVVEVKSGSTPASTGVLQAQSYRDDLRAFHSDCGEGGRQVSAAVLGPGAARSDAAIPHLDPAGLEQLVRQLSERNAGRDPLGEKWLKAPYLAHPTIVEAATATFARHDVTAISHYGAEDLDRTVERLREIIRHARATGTRHLCLVTGRPGSGKTLVGLTAVHPETTLGGEPLGAYLSGNGPLVDVLRYSLQRDLRTREDRITAGDAQRRASTIIQPVHGFIGELAASGEAPPEAVVVFDEAQRAWDHVAVERAHGLSKSEAELFLEIMDRRDDWFVGVALVGEGQEINRGEAGVQAWLDAARLRPHIEVHASSALAEGTARWQADSALHLNASRRALHASTLPVFVDALLTGDELASRRALSKMGDGFPVVMTRDLEQARDLLRSFRDDGQRVGLLASSQARRLRAHGIEMDGAFQGGVDWPKWFAEPWDSAERLKSSDTLEVAASEFKCQGLELDWTGVCWGGDLRIGRDGWRAHRLRGSRWNNDSKSEWAINRYRVLLTRARRGLVIWVPSPMADTPQFEAEWFDDVAAYLRGCGVRQLDAGATSGAGLQQAR